MAVGSEVPARSRSLSDHWLAVVAPVTVLEPILDGALHFGPSGLVHGDDKRQDKLTEHGRRFAAFLYGMLSDALRYAVDAWIHVEGTGQGDGFADLAKSARDRLEIAVLIARALMEPDVPLHVSGHDALKEVQMILREVGETLDGMKALADPDEVPPKARTDEAEEVSR